MVMDRTSYFNFKFGRLCAMDGLSPEVKETATGSYRDLFRFTVGYIFGIDQKPTEEIKLQEKEAEKGIGLERLTSLADDVASIMEGEYNDYVLRKEKNIRK